MTGMLTKKPWFYLCLLAAMFIPIYTQIKIPPEQTSLAIQQTLTSPVIYSFPVTFVVFKALFVFLLIWFYLKKDQAKPLSHLVISLLLLVVAIFQNISTKTDFGLTILLSNMVLQCVVIVFTLLDIKTRNNIKKTVKFEWWNILTLVLAFWAFWMPNDNGMFSLAISDLFLNESCLTYCMITPILLSMYLLFMDYRENPLLRITSFVGLYFGLMNMLTWFVLNRTYWWMGVLHLPLMINSLVGFRMSFKK